MEKLVYGGQGLARTANKVVMMPFVIPGETVTWQTIKEHPGHIEARLANIITPSEARIIPPCPVYGRCGGCHYQHLEYDLQVEHKKKILAESLQRIGKLTPPDEIGVLRADPYGYRNRIQIHFDGRRMGFRAAGSRNLVPIENCPLASPALQHALSAIQSRLRDHRFPDFLEEVELFTNEDEVVFNVLKSRRGVAKEFFPWMAQVIPGADQSRLAYQVGENRFRVSYQSFFQVNRFLLEPLVEAVLGEAKPAWALDLYAGVGLFSVPLAKRGGRVTAVEVVRGAAADLEHNKSAGVEVVQKAVEFYLEKFEGRPDLILADPPRVGLGKKTVEHLVRVKAPEICLVSCDPTTLARDAAGLVAGGYEITSLTMADLFPQTYHLEAIVRLRLR
ncbi:MAG: class I SAM-dependent RNA methyltransferase [Bryobacteraceae bacterium]|nr:class I SAM-dependent RNA methyltransferase [Bryobacteraceae bacterium]